MKIHDDSILLAIILAIAFLCFMLGAAIPAEPETLERWSGYEWQAMSPDQKVYYTAGLMTGLWFGARAQVAPTGSPAEAEVARFFAAVAAFLDAHDLQGAVVALERFYLTTGQRATPLALVLVAPNDRTQ